MLETMKVYRDFARRNPGSNLGFNYHPNNDPMTLVSFWPEISLSNLFLYKEGAIQKFPIVESYGGLLMAFENVPMSIRPAVVRVLFELSGTASELADSDGANESGRNFERCSDLFYENAAFLYKLLTSQEQEHTDVRNIAVLNSNRSPAYAVQM